MENYAAMSVLSGGNYEQEKTGLTQNLRRSDRKKKVSR